MKARTLATVLLLSLVVVYNTAAFTRKDAVEAQKALERIGKVYVDTNDNLVER